jgi:spermidine/putrescine transport system permease protein
VTTVQDEQIDQIEASVAGGGGGLVERDDQGRRSGGITPWLLLAPGLLFLLWFFFTPLYTLFRMSLSERTDRFSDPTFNWHWENYSDAFSLFGEQFFRSFLYAGIATVLALLIGYPLAYVIAFRGGRFRNVWLGLVVVPFFTNFLIRTLAWRTILGNEGWVVGVLRDVGILGESDSLLRTPLAVIGGLTYNFLPFMVLPIYVAIEKIDPGLVDAARDLYSNTWRAFRKIVFPMSLPGVFAGSLLVFIPAAGDFVNAYYLGNARTTMIGTVVQDQFLVQGNYPVAAALSFVFMAIVMVMVSLYARILGTEEIT